MIKIIEIGNSGQDGVYTKEESLDYQKELEKIKQQENLEKKKEEAKKKFESIFSGIPVIDSFLKMLFFSPNVNSDKSVDIPFIFP